MAGINFSKQVGSGFLGKVSSFLIAFIGSILLARILGPIGYGAFTFILSITKVLDNPVTGWARGCRKRLTETGFPSSEAVGSIFIGFLIYFPIIILLSFLLPQYFPNKWIGEQHWWAYPIFFLSWSLFISFNETLKVTEQFELSGWLSAGKDLIRVVSQLALVISGYFVLGMIGGLIIANVFALSIAIFIIGDFPTTPSMQSLKEIWSFAKSSIPLGIIGTAQGEIDIILLGVLATASVVGDYRVALTITIIGLFITDIIGGAILGQISRGKENEARDSIELGLSYSSVFSIPIFFGTLLIGETLVVSIYSSQYEGAKLFIVGLAIFRVLKSQKEILAMALSGLDRPEYNLYSSIIEFIFNVVLGVALFISIGPFGIVVSTIISEIVSYILRLRALKGVIHNLDPLQHPLISQVVSGFTMYVVLYVLGSITNMDGVLEVSVYIIVGIFIYSSILIHLDNSMKTALYTNWNKYT